MPTTFRPRGAPAQSRQAYDRSRDAAHDWRAWYKTSRWQKLRFHQLQAEPFCAFHLKRDEVVSASICDHVERHGGDEDKFWDGPFQSLCKTCHDSEKQSQERRRR